MPKPDSPLRAGSRVRVPERGTGKIKAFLNNKVVAEVELDKGSPDSGGTVYVQTKTLRRAGSATVADQEAAGNRSS